MKKRSLKPYSLSSNGVIEGSFRQFYINKDHSYDTNIKPHVGVILMSQDKIAQYVGTELLKR